MALERTRTDVTAQFVTLHKFQGFEPLHKLPGPHFPIEACRALAGRIRRPSFRLTKGKSTRPTGETCDVLRIAHQSELGPELQASFWCCLPCIFLGIHEVHLDEYYDSHTFLSYNLLVFQIPSKTLFRLSDHAFHCSVVKLDTCAIWHYRKLP